MIHKHSSSAGGALVNAYRVEATGDDRVEIGSGTLGWVATSALPENKSIQVSLVSGEVRLPRRKTAISVNVDDVDAAYTEARRRGYEIVHPLTDEAVRGPRRFFVRDPNGVIVNVVGHPD